MVSETKRYQHGRSVAELQTEHTRHYACVERSKNAEISGGLELIIIMKIRKQGLAMIHTHYDKEINREESVDTFAQLDTRKLEHRTLL